MKIEIILDLPDNLETDKHLRYMSGLEAAFAHSVNDLPAEYYDFVDNIQPGSKIKVNLEIIEDKECDIILP